jgi:hypothetical protein
MVNVTAARLTDTSLSSLATLSGESSRYSPGSYLLVMSKNSISVRQIVSTTLQPGEELLVARRLREALARRYSGRIRSMATP